MQNRLIQQLKFNLWHERQLFLSFAWLLSCLMCGFLFVAIIEFVGVNFSGIFSILSILVLYLIGIAIIELFRRFWMRFSFAQLCANSATCNSCGTYGSFEVRVGARPIYAHCQKCDHQWVIGQQKDRD
jgi:fatty-acid desaturase